jgi:hypothetical protein
MSQPRILITETQNGKPLVTLRSEIPQLEDLKLPIFAMKAGKSLKA